MPAFGLVNGQQGFGEASHGCARAELLSRGAADAIWTNPQKRDLASSLE